VKNSVFQAALVMITSVFFMVGMSTCAKLASVYHNPVEIVFYRGILSLSLLFGWLVITGRYELLKTSRPLMHLGRSVVGNISVCLVFWAYSLMPMAATTTILLTSGVMVTLLSVLILGEKVGPMRWAAVAFGLIGCLVATNPSDTEFNAYGTSVAIAAMLSGAFVAIFLRNLGKTEHPFTTVFYFILAGVLATGVYMIFAGSPPKIEAFWPIFGVGTASLVGLLLKTYAFKMAEISVLSPLTYTSLVWSTLSGWVFWGQLPELPVVLGAALVVGSNMVILWHEVRHARRKNAVPVIEG